MTEFQNYVPIEGSVGEVLIDTIPAVFFAFLAILAAWLLIREIRKGLEGQTMSIIIAFFCGLCAAILTDAIADYISAKAQMLEAQAEKLKLDNQEREQIKEQPF